MTYESRRFHDPSTSDSIHSKELLGYILADGCQNRLDALLGVLPTPPQQKAYNIATNKTELVKSWDPVTFYAPGEERHVPWKCTEWTTNYAIPALVNSGYILDTLTEEAAGSAADAGDVSGEWCDDSSN